MKRRRRVEKRREDRFPPSFPLLSSSSSSYSSSFSSSSSSCTSIDHQSNVPQGSELHILPSSRAGQGSPVSLLFLMTALERTSAPPPQSSLHDDHADQLPTTQSPDSTRHNNRTYAENIHGGGEGRRDDVEGSGGRWREGKGGGISGGKRGGKKE